MAEKPQQTNRADFRDEPARLLTVSEVADLFGVSPKTVSRWAREGRIASVRTLGGHRRFREAQVRELLDQIHPQ
ncbi:MAG: BldC family transcriptional regulator [Acidimicrobiia bacterium]